MGDPQPTSGREQLPAGPHPLSRRRLAVGLVAFTAALAAYIGLVDAVMARRFSAALDRLVATGQPATVREVWPSPTLPDRQNGALAYLKGEQLFAWPPGAAGIMSVRELQDPAFVLSHPDAVDQVLATNAAVLDLLATAPARTQWPRPSDDAAALAAMGALSFSEPILQSLGSACIVRSAQMGDAAASARWTEIALRYAASVAGDRPGLGAWYRSWSAHGTAMRALEAALPLWELSGDSVSAPDAAWAARSLLSALQDEEAMHAQCRAAYMAERVLYLERMPAINRVHLQGEVLPGSTPSMAERLAASATFPLRSPWVYDDSLELIERFDFYEQASFAGTYVEALRNRPGELEQRWGLARPWSRFANSPDAPVWWLHLNLSMRRMAATAVALRLYQAEHGGRPDLLADLVPDYLPRVPLDPFATDGLEIRYQPAAGPPRLYSVGRDGKDDGGIYRLSRRGRRDGSQQGDWLFYLEMPLTGQGRFGGGGGRRP